MLEQKFLVHRSDEKKEFERQVNELLSAGWQPIGPVGVMNMPRFDLYQTFQRQVPTPINPPKKKCEQSQ